MLFVTPAKARCSNGDKEYVTMFLPFVSEPNFLPIVRKTKGEHQRQLKRSHQHSIWRLPKFETRKGLWDCYFRVSRTRPKFTDIFRLLLTVPSLRLRLRARGKLLSLQIFRFLLIKDYFIQIWLFWPHVVNNYPVRCSTSQVYRSGCIFSLCHAVRERERQERR